jgi:hypothetical protein
VPHVWDDGFATKSTFRLGMQAAAAHWHTIPKLIYLYAAQGHDIMEIISW